jgi:alpha-L-rhamnosidase
MSGSITTVVLASALMLAAVPAPAIAAKVTLTDLKCEYKVNPIGIDVLQPRLSWQFDAAERGVAQTAYQIRVAQTVEGLQGSPLWDSGRVDSDASHLIAYAGPSLQSGRRYHWQVRAWTGSDAPTAWSATAFWEMGLLNPEEWKAQWIQADLREDPEKSNPAAMLRKEFELPGTVQSARAYVSALGLYEMELNGRRVGDEALTPGWTAYDSRIQYQTYDVTSHLRQGRNVVGVTLGDGWYRGNLGFQKQRNTYGDKTALLLQIHVVDSSGRTSAIASDGSWKSATGPILESDIYNGETYDARLERPGWSSPGFNDRDWKSVRILDHSKEVLVAPAGPPVRKIEEIRPVKVLRTPAGDTVLDMGQNMVGWIRLNVQGPSGTRVTLRHAEVLDKQGNLYTENLRAAGQTNTYILRGGGPEVFEPRFTFQGFRYVAVQGYPGEVKRENFTGVVVHSDITPTGAFECSNPMLNQLQHNIRWGQKGNFVDVPTDCPQRDERLGWTGDAQVFARTAAFNHDVAAFYAKWLKDLAADQKASGAVPHVLPNVLNRKDPAASSASAGWADAAVIVPWTVYLAYGDMRILEQQYPSMKAWVDYMANKAGSSYYWNSDFTYGDWLAFATTRSDYPGATTDKDLICQAYFARSTDLLQRTAALLGRQDDAARYAELLGKIRKVFVEEFVTAKGRLASNTQTAYALALGFDLLPENMRAIAAKRLAEDVRRFKHLTTGFLGTPLLCQVLADHGYWDEAFLLLNRKEYPSWLYPVTQGATTIWERWDGQKPDGTFQDKGMNSFNHYAYGAIGEWLYKAVAGIELDPQQPGYKHILLQPHPGGGLENAKAALETPYGRTVSDWSIRSGKFSLAVEVPPNSTATVRLPGASQNDVREGGRPLAVGSGVTRISAEGGAVLLEIGSGKYVFEYPWLNP